MTGTPRRCERGAHDARRLLVVRSRGLFWFDRRDLEVRAETVASVRRGRVASAASLSDADAEAHREDTSVRHDACRARQTGDAMTRGRENAVGRLFGGGANVFVRVFYGEKLGGAVVAAVTCVRASRGSFRLGEPGARPRVTPSSRLDSFFSARQLSWASIFADASGEPHDTRRPRVVRSRGLFWFDRRDLEVRAETVASVRRGRVASAASLSDADAEAHREDTSVRHDASRAMQTGDAMTRGRENAVGPRRDGRARGVPVGLRGDLARARARRAPPLRAHRRDRSRARARPLASRRGPLLSRGRARRDLGATLSVRALDHHYLEAPGDEPFVAP